MPQPSPVIATTSRLVRPVRNQSELHLDDLATAGDLVSMFDKPSALTGGAEPHQPRGAGAYADRIRHHLAGRAWHRPQPPILLDRDQRGRGGAVGARWAPSRVQEPRRGRGR